MVDYPRADVNLSIRLSELTKVRISRDGEREPRHFVLPLTDPSLFRCPFVMMTEPGGLTLDDAEVARLREYLLKGGFLWADDFWGEIAWQNFEQEMRKVLPAQTSTCAISTATIRSSARSFPCRRSSRSRRSTSGRAPAATPPNGATTAASRAPAPSSTRQGRVVMLATHNTDYGDSWEREGDDPDYFQTFSIDGYAFGINVVLYAMSH